MSEIRPGGPHSAELIDFVPSFPRSMSALMTFAAQADKVIRIETDVRIPDVLRIQFNDVVNFFRRNNDSVLQTINTQPVISLHYRLTASLPCH